MKKVLKKIVKSDAFLSIIAYLVSLYLRLVFNTTKWHYIGREKMQSCSETYPTIGCFWHNRVSMSAFLMHWSHKKVVALISPSPIGTITMKAFKRFKVHSIGGSSNRNPISSYRGLLAEIKAGSFIAIIPDGPRGPAMKAKPGFVHLASKANAAIVPVTYSISKYKILNTWDKMRIPLPFSLGIFAYGDPIFIPICKEEELNDYCLELEKKITELQDSTDMLLEKMLLGK